MSPAARPVLVVLVVLVIAAVLAVLAGIAVGRPEQGGRLSVSGSVAGLVPGQRATLDVTVRNRTHRTVRVVRVTARVRTAPRGCPAAALRLGTARPGHLVRSGRATVVRLPVRLVRAAPDACQGVTFPLTLRAFAGAR